MSKFNTTKQKLRTLWENIFRNTSDLKNIDNNDQTDFLAELSKELHNKAIRELNNSGFSPTIPRQPDDQSSIIVLEPDESFGDVLITTTVNKETVLPHMYISNFLTNVCIAERFLPFVKVVPEIQNIPTHTLIGGGLFTASRFGVGNDIITIRGDGALLYQGVENRINADNQIANELVNVFTEDELADFEIPLNNTKKVWRADIEFTEIATGDKFRIVGDVTKFNATFDVGFGCDAETNQDKYEALVFQEGGFTEKGDNEVLLLTATTFTVKAQEILIRHVNVPPCTQQNTFNEGVTKSGSFSATSAFAIQVRGRHTGVDPDTFIGNNQVVNVNSAFHIITKKTFTDPKERRPYYSSALEGVLSIEDTGSPDGNFFDEVELKGSDLPNTSKGHTLPYTQIIFQRNFQTFDREEFETDEWIQSSRKQIPVYLKRNDNDFVVNYSVIFLLSNPATEVVINSRQFPEYNDFYTQSGTSYALTTEVHSFLGEETEIYKINLTDQQARTRIYLQNPLYWREKRKYGI